MHAVEVGLTRTPVWAVRAPRPIPAWATVAAVAVGVVMFVSVVLIVIVSSRPPDREDDGAGGSGTGGGGPPRLGPDGGRSPNGDPVWWAEFERQFAAHVAGTGRARDLELGTLPKVPARR